MPREESTLAMGGSWKEEQERPIGGRWPANLIHDGSEEVVTLFPLQQSGGTPAIRNSDKFRTAYGTFKGGHVEDGISSSEGSAARFFYCAKASNDDRDDGCETPAPFETSGPRGHSLNGDGTERPAALPRANTHPTVKPTDLMRWLCRLVTPPRGLVLDPFNGSGSTGKACMLEGFRYIGIERDLDSVQTSVARIGAAGRQLTLGI